jgi:Ca2+-binding RTX toxin-like protein
VLTGGAGSDTVSYINATAGVSVALSTSVAQNTLGAGIDTLTGFENLTGSNFNDTLSGDGGNNVLNGGAGSDTVSYGNATAGVTVALSTSAAQNTLGAGIDTLTSFENLTGSDHADRLTGGAGANSLNGGLGNDTLVASGGVDTLTGGGSAGLLALRPYVDRFVFNSVTDSPNASPDIITDFAPSIGEKVDVSGIDANTLLAGNQAFNWIGNILPTPARLSQGELGYQISGADIFLIGNTSSAVGTPDFRVQLQGLGASGGLIATDMTL